MLCSTIQDMNSDLSNTNIYLTTFGAVYSCNSYGAGSYNSGQECTTTTDGGTTGNSGGSLVDTGLSVALPLVIGIVLIAIPVVYFVKRHFGKKQTSIKNR